MSVEERGIAAPDAPSMDAFEAWGRAHIAAFGSLDSQIRDWLSGCWHAAIVHGAADRVVWFKEHLSEDSKRLQEKNKILDEIGAAVNRNADRIDHVEAECDRLRKALVELYEDGGRPLVGYYTDETDDLLRALIAEPREKEAR